MSRYQELRAAVIQVLDAELGHDADGMRRMLTQALEHDDEREGGCLDRETAPPSCGGQRDV